MSSEQKEVMRCDIIYLDTFQKRPQTQQDCGENKKKNTIDAAARDP